MSLISTAGLDACTASNAADMHRPSSPPVVAAAVPPLYAGRFVAAPPVGVTVAAVEAELQDLEVAEVAWPTEPGAPGAAPRPARDAATRVWAARLAQLRADASKRPPAAADVVIQQRQLAPDLWLVYRHDGRANASLVAAEALVNAGPHGVWIRAPYQAGHEADVIPIFTRIARSYRAYRPGEPRPDDAPAFHLRGGAFSLPFEYQESLQVYLDAAAHGLTGLRLTFRTGASAEWGDGLIAEWRAKQRSALLSRMVGGGPVTLLRANARTVAGMPGEEVVARFDQPGRAPELALAWEYRGTADAPVRPHTVITASATDGRTTDALGAWDQLLGSLRALPHNDAVAPSGAGTAR